MKRLNLQTLALIACSLLIMATFAPQALARGGDIEKRLEKMTEHLELTADQVGQVRGILENAKTQAEALREQDGDRASKREAMKALRDESQSQIASILTADQRAKFEAMKAKKKEKRGDKKGGRKGDRI